MKLSIIIPVFNVEQYISECLNSLLPYVNDEVEVFIIDDCSTDNTLQYIRYTIIKYPLTNITVIANPVNKGVSYSRNQGLKHCKGKYVAFIDGDDYVEKIYIRELMRFCHSNYDYALLSWSKVGISTGKYYSRCLPKWNYAVWCRVFKKDIIKFTFDESMIWGEDMKFLDQNITGSMKCAYIDDYVYVYRFGRSGSITSDRCGR